MEKKFFDFVSFLVRGKCERSPRGDFVCFCCSADGQKCKHFADSNVFISICTETTKPELCFDKTKSKPNRMMVVMGCMICAKCDDY